MSDFCSDWDFLENVQTASKIATSSFLCLNKLQGKSEREEIEGHHIKLGGGGRGEEQPLLICNPSGRAAYVGDIDWIRATIFGEEKLHLHVFVSKKKIVPSFRKPIHIFRFLMAEYRDSFPWESNGLQRKIHERL